MEHSSMYMQALILQCPVLVQRHLVFQVEEPVDLIKEYHPTNETAGNKEDGSSVTRCLKTPQTPLPIPNYHYRGKQRIAYLLKHPLIFPPPLQLFNNHLAQEGQEKLEVDQAPTRETHIHLRIPVRSPHVCVMAGAEDEKMTMGSLCDALSQNTGDNLKNQMSQKPKSSEKPKEPGPTRGNHVCP
ncbi:hypothetical protein TREES_T100007526 [Tupaia chinensis]|uniref:Uncharacterized protein n=1 Tax=Tupaia chinensis TaxID=246437 RepID=L9KYM7_TUPCH|nr:hypothetical protein TREES_T100007526 [Tupaia chinensis]